MALPLRSLKKTWKSFKRQPLMHLASIATISVSCLILGSFLLGYRNFENLAEQTNTSITGTAYLKSGLTELQISDLRERLLSQENVSKVTFKSKNRVADELQDFLGASAGEALPGSELFPDLMEIELNRESSSQTVTSLKTMFAKDAAITELDFSDDWLAQYKKVRSFLNSIGWVLIVGLVFGCGFIIANFMGIRHQSRKEEMEIIQLIGAERGFVLAPFLWEGLFEGLMGAGLSLVLLSGMKWILGDLLVKDWQSLLGISSWAFLSLPQSLLLLILGITMALMGSLTVFFRTTEQLR